LVFLVFAVGTYSGRMLMLVKGHRNARRSGAHLIECAFILPLTMLLLIGLAVCAMGVFRYQQMSYLAREAARYAAVHAGEYQQENAAAIAAGTLPDVTSAYIITKVIQANSVSLDPSALSVSINFNMSGGSYDWDDTANNGGRWPYSPRTIDGTTYNETNTVSVTVTYQWVPEWLLSGPITITSTAVMPVCY
jgi:Flp pilus assembly protein TadG